MNGAWVKTAHEQTDHTNFMVSPNQPIQAVAHQRHVFPELPDDKFYTPGYNFGSVELHSVITSYLQFNWGF